MMTGRNAMGHPVTLTPDQEKAVNALFRPVNEVLRDWGRGAGKTTVLHTLDWMTDLERGR